MTSIFVFGHKPIVSPLGVTTSDEAINPALVPGLESLLDSTTKVKGYFCAHAHEWDARKLPGPAASTRWFRATAGVHSRLPGMWSALTTASTQARVYKSGRVGVVSYQRPVPNPYNSSPATPAKPVAELTIAP